MQLNVLWTGREYYSLENCLINLRSEQIEINSTIIGYYQNKIYFAKYFIKTNNKWRTFFVDVKYRINNVENRIRLERKSNTGWLLNNIEEHSLSGCTDVDISVTPFTNTLPVKRLQLAQNEEKKIKVIYINILDKEVKPVIQSYQRISATKYLYQNVPNDFQAEIEVDEFGLVVDYPSLFKRTAFIKTE